MSEYAFVEKLRKPHLELVKYVSVRNGALGYSIDGQWFSQRDLEISHINAGLDFAREKVELRKDMIRGVTALQELQRAAEANPTLKKLLVDGSVRG